MKDEQKTKAELIEELTELRQRVRELEKLLTEQRQALSPLEQESQIFNSALKIGQVMTIIMEGVRALLDVSICSLWLIEPEVLNLNDFLDQLEPSFRRLLGSRIKLMQRTEPHLASIKFDPGFRVSQLKEKSQNH